MITIVQQRTLKYGMKQILKLKSFFKLDQDLDVYYFGYGANLSIDRFRKWYIPAEIVGTGYIENHQIKFNLPCEYKRKGFAGIEEKLEKKVWGVVFKVNSKALKMLDILEWVPFNFYERKLFEVLCNGKTYENTYSYVTCHPRDDLVPSKSYLDFIIQSGLKSGFPSEYLEELLSTPSMIDFEFDLTFVLRDPSKKRILSDKLSGLYLLHDRLREKLTRLIP
jgi:gamma-glutamylcyclotransferase (GGCT)/AIG2-like uncharacterized protein YtfP